MIENDTINIEIISCLEETIDKLHISGQIMPLTFEMKKNAKAVIIIFLKFFVIIHNNHVTFKVLNQNLNEIKESQSNKEALFNQALEDPNADKVSTATRNLKAATHGIERAMKQNPLGDDIFGKIELDR